MPDLVESLQGRDYGHLQIIADLWGEKLAEQELPAAITELSAWILTRSRVERLVESLPEEAKAALTDMSGHNGRLPWAGFTRQYGEVREMGAARRDREQPHKQPISPAETLWYRGLIARAFFDTPSGAEEFAYIPTDLLMLFPGTAEAGTVRLGRQASASEYAQVFMADDRILDQSCTLLAALRMGISPPLTFSFEAGEEMTADILKSMLAAAGMLEASGMPQPEPVRVFLEAPRGEALSSLVRAWMDSERFNELKLLPNLSLEGNWKNDPLRTRQAILGYLHELKPGTWWSLAAFIAALQQKAPDFQRPAGDYDSWFIRDNIRGEYLRGFESWEMVDGRLLRYLVSGPLHWLGMVDLGCTGQAREVTAFRLSRYWGALAHGKIPGGLPAEKESVIARSDARVSARRLVPRGVRYQLARFCEWEKETPEEYQYRITSVSLEKARQQGLKVSQLVALLKRYAQAVAPSLLIALERWDQHGSEARMEKLVILRVTSAEVLQVLQKSRASRFLGQPLSPTTIALKPGATLKVLAALAELGYLGEIREDTPST